LDAIGNAQGLVNQRNCPKQWVGFAIELETELQEATFEIERLRKSNLQLREGAEQQKQRIIQLEEELMDAKNKHSVLIADVVLYEDRGERIKRLEEAGDVLCAAAAFMGWHMEIEKWNEAKEAKL
jgi:hypothetical protein